MFIIEIISALLIAFVVFCFYKAVKTQKKSNAQQEQMSESKAFDQITKYILQNGIPSQIFITTNDEIFYGPIDGTFLQVPSNMIPPMNHLERYSLGSAFANKFDYKRYTCFDHEGRNLGIVSTGNGYLDDNTDIYVVGSAATGSWN